MLNKSLSIYRFHTKTSWLDELSKTYIVYSGNVCLKGYSIKTSKHYKRYDSNVHGYYSERK